MEKSSPLKPSIRPLIRLPIQPTSSASRPPIKPRIKIPTESIIKTSSVHTPTFKGIIHSPVKSPVQPNSKTVKRSVTYLPIGLTGLRHGERILSTNKSKQNEGSDLRVHKSGSKPGDLILPPQSKFVNTYTGNYEDFYSISFFQGMPLPEIRRYVEKNVTSNEIYMSDPGTDLQVQIINLKGSAFAKIEPDDLSRIMYGGEETIPLNDLYQAIPKKPGSRARRHTLVFRPSIWYVAPPIDFGNEPPDYIFDLVEMKMIPPNTDLVVHYQNRESRHRFNFKLTYPKNNDPGVTPIREGPHLLTILSNSPGDDDNFWNGDLSFLNDSDVASEGVALEGSILSSYLNPLTPGALKSALQKIIRTGAGRVILPTSDPKSEVSGRSFLVHTFKTLYLNSGSFVPDLKKFVIGAESALKRLAVSISEDAYTFDHEALTGLYVAALIVQKQPSWRPTPSMVERWMKMAIEAYNTPNVYFYTTDPLPQVVADPSSSFYLNFAILSEMGSFKSDLNMLASTPSGPEQVLGIPPDWGEIKLMYSMPLEQIIDHHTFTEIAYMIPIKFTEEVIEIISMLPIDIPLSLSLNDYKPLYDNIFRFVTGVNPRRTDRFIRWFPNNSTKQQNYYHEYEQYPFVKFIRAAQSFILRSKLPSKFPSKIDTNINLGYYESEYELSDQWIAGMLGATEVTSRGTTYYASLSVQDIESFVVVYKPVRGLKKSKVEDEDRLTVEAKFEYLLKVGLPLQAVPKSMRWFEGALVYLNTNALISAQPGGETKKRTYELKLKDSNLRLHWYELRFQARSFPLIRPLTGLDTLIERLIQGEDIYPEELLRFYQQSLHREGIEDQADEKLDSLLKIMPTKIMQRLFVYLTNPRSKIEMLKISRSGKGQELPIHTEDNLVYMILNQLCIWYPSALRRSLTSPTKVFDVKYGPLFWSIRDRFLVAGSLIVSGNSENSENSENWMLGIEDTNRKPFDYQLRSIDRMLRSHGRGNLIYAPTGIGKSYMTMKTIRTMIEDGNRGKGKGMPRYCLYTLPPSALKTIGEELDLIGLPYRVLTLTKLGIKNLPRGPSDRGGNIIFMNPYEITLVKHDHLKEYGFPEYLATIADDLFFVIDEFHKAMGNSRRTGVILDLVQMCRNFIGMSATVIRSEDLDPVIRWLEHVVDFEVNYKNIWTAVNGMIALTDRVPVVSNRNEIEVLFSPAQKEEYDRLLNRGNPGRVDPRVFNQALNLCYEACQREMMVEIEHQLGPEKNRRGVFCIVRNHRTAEEFMDTFVQGGILKLEEIHIITTQSPINLKADDRGPIRLVLTTPQHSEGYNATKMDTVIKSVYLSNQATREQLDGRTIRLGQDREVNIYTFYIGLLQKIWVNYQKVGSMSLALKGAAEEIGLNRGQLKEIG